MIQQVSGNSPQSQKNEDIRRDISNIFEIPQISSQSYREKITEIFQSFASLDEFTNKLEEKVDKILAVQEDYFVSSYQQHMQKIKEQFVSLQNKINKQEDQIKYYENEGKMSELVKKVHLLENESKKLYLVIDKKEKMIKDLILENKVQKQQNKRLSGQVKEFLKNRISKEVFTFSVEKPTEKKQNSVDKSKFFTTEIQQQRSIKGELSRTTDENKVGFTYNLSEKSGGYGEYPYLQKPYPQKQISNLKMKNRKLISFTSKIFESKSQLQTIFIDCINEIKKQIKIRKKIRECSYQDFRKEDKLNILVAFISNEDVLQTIYQKLFEKKKIQSENKSESFIRTQFQKNVQLQKSKEKIVQKDVTFPQLPPTKV